MTRPVKKKLPDCSIIYDPLWSPTRQESQDLTLSCLLKLRVSSCPNKCQVCPVSILNRYLLVLSLQYGASYILACDAIYRSIAIDSKRKKTAISGVKKAAAPLPCLENLTDRIISVMSQVRLRRGAKTNRNKRTVNPESI